MAKGMTFLIGRAPLWAPRGRNSSIKNLIKESRYGYASDWEASG